MTGLLDFARRGTGLRHVMGASLCARLPIGMTGITLPLFVLSRGLGPLPAACAVAAFGVGQAAGSPVWGRQSDKRPLRGLVLLSTSSFAALTLIIVAVPSTAIGYVSISLILGLCALPFSAVMRSFWLRQDLGAGQEAAARFESWLSEAVLLGGRVIVSSLLLALSCGAILNAQAGLAVFGGAALAATRRIRVDRPVPHTFAGRRARDVIAYGRQYATYLLLSASLGSYSFALILKLSDRSSVWAAGGVAAWGLGSLVGVSIAPKRSWPVPGALIGMGLAQALLLFAPGGSIGVMAAVVAGLPIALIVTRLFDFLAAATPSHRRGEVFAWASTCLFVGNSLGTAAAGLWADALAATTSVLVAVALAGAAAIAAR